MQDALRDVHPKPKIVSELKLALEKILSNFSTGPINRVVPSFRKSLSRVCEG